MDNKKISLFLVIFLFVGGLLTLTGCQNKEEEVIKIGSSFALSGKFAHIGTQELNGLQMAVDEINSEGGINGKKIILISEDNAGEPSKAISSVQKLINIDDVSYLFSAFTHLTSALYPIVIENNKFLIYQSSYEDIAKESKYIFNDLYSTKEQAKLIVDFVVEKGYNKIGLISEQGDACNEIDDIISNGLEKEGISLDKYEKFDSATKDLKTEILKVNPKELDVVLTCAWRNEPIFMKDYIELGFKDTPTIHIMGPFDKSSRTSEMEKLWKENKAYSTWFYDFEILKKEGSEQLVSDFVKRYNTTITAFAAYLYDDMKFLSEALTYCDKKTTYKDYECVSDYLINNKYEGMSGVLDFNEDGNILRPSVIIQYQENGWNKI